MKQQAPTPQPSIPPRRQYMDFVRRPNPASSQAAASHSSRPAACPSAASSSSPSSHPASARRSTRPTSTVARPASSGAAATSRPAVTARTRAGSHTARPRPATSRRSSATARSASAARPAPEPELLELEDLEFDTIETIETVEFNSDSVDDFLSAPEPLLKDSSDRDDTKSAPDANRYSLGGRSPFIPSVTVDKRPLSSHVPTSTPRPTGVKNSYPRRSNDGSTPTRRDAPTVIVNSPKKKLNIVLIIAIALTIIVAIPVGVVAYLALCQ